MPTVTGEWTWARAEHAVLARGRGADSAWTVRIAQPGASTVSSCRAGWRRPKRCSAERGVPRAVPPSAWNWSTKQPEGQASEEFNGQAGFSETGGFGTAALAAGTVAAKGLAARAPTGTPAFRTLGRTGMKITHRQHGGHAHQRTRDLPGGL